MLVEVTCPHCRHRGHVPQDMLPRLLSGCGRIARFERGKALDTARPPAPKFVAGASVDEDTLASLWEGDAEHA
jgi:hypothetical protein